MPYIEPSSFVYAPTWTRPSPNAPDKTWTVLSRACNHHAYEFSPTAAELGTWLESVDEVVRVVVKRVA
jgi:hypothetical protein